MARNIGIRDERQAQKYCTGDFFRNERIIRLLTHSQESYDIDSEEYNDLAEEIREHKEQQFLLLGRMFHGCMANGRDPLTIFRDERHEQNQEFMVYIRYKRELKEYRHDIAEFKHRKKAQPDGMKHDDISEEYKRIRARIKEIKGLLGVVAKDIFEA